MNITLVLAVRNGIEMTKQAYSHFRNLYPTVPFSISSGGSTDGTKEWGESLNDPNLIFSHTDENICFSANYNKAISQVSTDKIVLIHNDMIPGSGFLEELEKHITPNNIVTYTTIEPPIFPGHDRPGKLIRDFGRDFSSFNQIDFEELVKHIRSQNDQVTEGCAFFMSGYKSSFDEIGGFDEQHFHPVFCEDDDILLRFKLVGKELITINKALVYHLVSQTIRFSDDFKDITSPVEQASNANFVRKWNMGVGELRNNEYWRKGINFKFYDIAYKIKNSSLNIIKMLEPFGTSIYTDIEIPLEFIQEIQTNSTFNIKNKIKDFDTIESEPVVIELDSSKLDNTDLSYIVQMPLILNQIESEGLYEIGNLKIKVNNFNTKSIS